MKFNNIFFADLETVTSNTDYFKKYQDTRLNVGYIENGATDEGFYFLDFKNLIEFFYNHSKNVLIYFHNLSFDGDFILKGLAKNDKFKAVNGDNEKVNYSFSFLRQINKIYAIRIMFRGKNKKIIKVELRCSLNILSSSVEALGKAIGINKYENGQDTPEFYDVEPCEKLEDYPKEYLDYLKRDVSIVKQSILLFDNQINHFINNSFFKNYLNNFNGSDKLTAGSIAYEFQKRYTKKGKQINQGLKISQKSHDLASLFYFGGFCEFNPQIQNKITNCPGGVGLDINSAHPASMTLKLPYGEIYNFNEKQPENEHFLEYYEIEVLYAEAKYNTIPCLINGNKINKENEFSQHRYVLKLDNFKCYYLKEEGEILNQFYMFHGVKIVNKYGAAASCFLKKFTEDLYYYKEKYSKENKKALANTYKILLNSSYGKHATRLIFSEFFICENEQEYNYYKNVGVLDNGKRQFEVSECPDRVKLPNQFILKITPTETREKNYNKLIAATITAYTRIKLLKTILLMDPKQFLYCDTDSIYLKKYHKKRIISLLDDYKLGLGKEEKFFDTFIVSGAKCYAYFKDEKKIGATYSGINKKWLKDNWDIGLYTSQENVLEKANLKIGRCASGLVIVPADYQPKKRLH